MKYLNCNEKIYILEWKHITWANAITWFDVHYINWIGVANSDFDPKYLYSICVIIVPKPHGWIQEGVKKTISQGWKYS